MRHLGVLGGTFDPIHKGHITLARCAIERCGLDGVLFAPAACPPHKENHVSASPKQRLKMCKLAIRDDERLQVTDADMRSQPSYTVSLMKRLKKEYPDTAFSFIIGADKLPSLPKWKGAEELFKLCDFICCPRAGEDVSAALPALCQSGARVQVLENVDFPGASSEVREKVARLVDPEELDEKVLGYIAENGLYQPDFLPKLKNMMNEHRFRHTLGVREAAVALAQQYGAPVLKAATAALLHDCAKGMSGKELRKMALEHHLTEDETILASGALMHGLVGAQLAQDKFGIQDAEMLDAIRYHTIGRENMTVLDLVIFVADAIEPNREDYEGLEEQRRIVQDSLRAAALKSLYTTRDYLASQGKLFFEAGSVTIRDLENKLTDEEKMLL